jgi:hypothetical protein
MPRPASSPAIRRYPQPSFSPAIRNASRAIARCVAGRHGRLCRDLAAQRGRTRSLCQATIVAGLTTSRSVSRSVLGISASSAASHARSDQTGRGRGGLVRCSTASWVAQQQDFRLFPGR